jgi:hypothetical protein
MGELTAEILGDTTTRENEKIEREKERKRENRERENQSETYRYSTERVFLSKDACNGIVFRFVTSNELELVKEIRIVVSEIGSLRDDSPQRGRPSWGKGRHGSYTESSQAAMRLCPPDGGGSRWVCCRSVTSDARLVDREPTLRKSIHCLPVLTTVNWSIKAKR